MLFSAGCNFRPEKRDEAIHLGREVGGGSQEFVLGFL